MKKSFTYPIPDELYVNKFDKNLQYSGTYDGPDKLYVIVSNGTSVVNYSLEPIEFGYDHVNERVVELDPQFNPAAADYLVKLKEPYEFTYRDVKNHDESIYKEISNPRLNEYFNLYWFDPNIWELRLIEKNTTFFVEEMVKQDYDKIYNYKIKYDFGDDNAEFDNYLEEAQKFLDILNPLKPWKYSQLNDIPPKIPVKLLKLIKELGE